MELDLDNFCIDTDQIEDLVYRCQKCMTFRDRDTLKLRQSYNETINILLVLAVKKGKSEEEFKQIYKLVHHSFVKMMQVIKFYCDKPVQFYSFDKQNKKEYDQEKQQSAILFGDLLLDKNGNLVKSAQHNRTKNIYTQLSKTQGYSIEKIKYQTQQKINSLNTHIITNELKQVNSYFQFCKNNFNKFLIEQGKQIGEIWRKSKQSYWPTMALIEEWKQKLERQLEQLRQKLSLLEKQLTRITTQNKMLKDKLDSYNKKTSQYYCQTPYIHDEKILQLNNRQKRINQQSKRLYNLIVSYQEMIRSHMPNNFYGSNNEVKKIRDEIKKSHELIKKLQEENIRIKQQQNIINQQSSDNDQTEEGLLLLKELKAMPAFQRQLYNNAIYKFIHAMKQISKHPIDNNDDETVITIGTQMGSFNFKMNKAMFADNDQKQNKRISADILKRHSKITQFNMEKLNQNLESYQKRISQRNSILNPYLLNQKINISSQSGQKIKRMGKSLMKKSTKSAIMSSGNSPNKQKQAQYLNAHSRQSSFGKKQSNLLYSASKLSAQVLPINQQLSKVYLQKTQQKSQKIEFKDPINLSFIKQPVSKNNLSKSYIKDKEKQQQQIHLQGKNIVPIDSSPQFKQTTLILQIETKSSKLVRSKSVEQDNQKLSLIKKSNISVQTDQFKYLCSKCHQQKQLTGSLNQQIKIKTLSKQTSHSQIPRSEKENELKNNVFIKSMQAKYFVPRKTQIGLFQQIDKMSQSHSYLKKKNSNTISKKLKDIIEQKQKLNETDIKPKKSSKQQNIQPLFSVALSTAKSLIQDKRYSQSAGCTQRNKSKLFVQNQFRKSEFRKSNSYFNKVKDQRNQLFIEKAIQRSFNESMMPQEVRDSLNINQIKNSNQIHQIIAKIKQLHQKTCQANKCDHLSRFYESIHKCFSNNNPFQKQRLAMNTLKINKIQHI